MRDWPATSRENRFISAQSRNQTIMSRNYLTFFCNQVPSPYRYLTRMSKGRVKKSFCRGIFSDASRLVFAGKRAALGRLARRRGACSASFFTGSR